MAKGTTVILVICTLHSIGSCEEPIPRIAVEPRNLVVWKSQQVTLPCLVANGTAAISYEWLHNDRSVDVTGGRQMLTLEKNGSLVIASFDERDIGNYYCLVRFVIDGRVFAMRSVTARLDKYGPVHKLSHPPRNTTVYVNNAAYFDCYPDSHIPVPIMLNALNNSHYYHNGNLLWRRNGIPVQDNLGTSDHKYLPNGGLLINNVSQRQDTEVPYVEHCCCIINGLPHEMCASLIILPSDGNRAPNLTVEPYNSTVSVGGTVVVPCVASGVPRPEVTWYKEGVEKAVSNSQNVIASNVLVIKNITVDDSGIYHCVARNSEGMVDQTVSITVIDVPRVKYTYKPNSKIHLGDQTRLTCPVLKTNYPLSVVNNISHVNVTWLLNGIPVDSTGYRQKVVRKYKLIISSMDTSNDGLYQCLVENQLGSVQTSFLLQTYGPPTQPGKISLHLTPDNGNLSWEHSDPSCQIAGCQITGYNVTASLFEGVPRHKFTLQTFQTFATLFDTEGRQGIFRSPKYLKGSGAEYTISVTANNLFGESTPSTNFVYVGYPINIIVSREPQLVRIAIPLPKDVLEPDITPSICQFDSHLCNDEDGGEWVCKFCVKYVNLESPSLGVSFTWCDNCPLSATHIVVDVDMNDLQWNTIYQFSAVLQLADHGLKKTTSLPVNCSTGMTAPIQQPKFQQIIRLNSGGFDIEYKGIDLDSVRSHTFYYQLNIHSQDGKLAAQLSLPSATDNRSSINGSVFHVIVDGTAHGLEPNVNYKLTLQSCCDKTTCKQWASMSQCGTMTLVELEKLCNRTCNCTSPAPSVLIGSPPTRPGKPKLDQTSIPGNGILTWQPSKPNCHIMGCQIIGYNVTVGLYYDSQAPRISQTVLPTSLILFTTEDRQGIFRSPESLHGDGARYGFAVTAMNSFGESTSSENNFYVGCPIDINVMRKSESVMISFPLPKNSPSKCQMESNLCSGGKAYSQCSFCVNSTNLKSPTLAVSVVRCDDCPLAGTHIVVNVLGLQWNTIYQFFAMLQLSLDGVKTTSSPPVKCSTGITAPTQRPEIQQALKINSGSFYIKFKGIGLDSVRSDAFYYQLNIYNESGEPIVQRHLPSDHRNNTNDSMFDFVHTVHGLKSFVKYELTLESCCDNLTCRKWASTAQCGTMTVTELEDVCYKTCNCTNSTLSVSIEPQPISIKQYTVDSQWVVINGNPILDTLVIKYMVNISSQSSHDVEIVKQLPANISGLQPETTYTAFVSVLIYDRAYPVQLLTFTTLGLDSTGMNTDTPGHVVVKQYTVDSQWVVINGNPILDPLVMKYMVNISPQSSNRTVIVKQLPVNISGLQPATIYKVLISVLIYDRWYPAPPFTFTTLGMDSMGTGRSTPSQELITAVYHTDETTPSDYDVSIASTTSSDKHSNSTVLILSTLLGLMVTVVITVFILYYFCNKRNGRRVWTRMRLCQSEVSTPDPVGPYNHTYESTISSSSSDSDHEYEDLGDDAMSYNHAINSEEESQHRIDAQIRNNRNWNYQDCDYNQDGRLLSDISVSQGGGTWSYVTIRDGRTWFCGEQRRAAEQENNHGEEEIAMSDLQRVEDTMGVDNVNGEAGHTTTTKLTKVPGTPDSSQMHTEWEDNTSVHSVYLQLSRRQDDHWIDILDVPKESHPLEEHHPAVASASSLGQLSDRKEIEQLGLLRKTGLDSSYELDSEGEGTAVEDRDNNARSPDYTECHNEWPNQTNGNRHARGSHATVISPLIDSRQSAKLGTSMESTSDIKAKTTSSSELKDTESESEGESDFVDLRQFRTASSCSNMENRATISPECKESTNQPIASSDSHGSRSVVDIAGSREAGITSSYPANWCYQSVESQSSNENNENDLQSDVQDMASFLSSVCVSGQLGCDDSSEAGDKNLQINARLVATNTNSTMQPGDRTDNTAADTDNSARGSSLLT